MLSVVVAFLAVARYAGAVTFDGPCPKIKGPPFTCEKEFGSSKKFYVMAHLPTTNHTLNFFYSPAEDLECLQATLNCYGDADTSDEKLLAETSMFFTIERLYLEPDEVEIPPPPHDDNENGFVPDMEIFSPLILAEHVDLMHNDGASVYHTDFYRGIDDCTGMKEKMWTNMTVVKTVPKQYTVLWGCHDLPGGKHEEGAWILGYRKNYTDIKKKHLDEAIKVLTDMKSSAAHKDFRINKMETFAVEACPRMAGVDMDVFGTCRTGV
jgi:hypothetical protein